MEGKQIIASAINGSVVKGGEEARGEAPMESRNDDSKIQKERERYLRAMRDASRRKDLRQGREIDEGKLQTRVMVMESSAEEG